MDPLCNELSTCCNHYYTTAALMSLTQIYGHLVLFGGGGLYIWKSHDGGWSIGAASALGSVGHMGIVIVTQHTDTPHEHAEMLSLDGGMKIMEGSTIVLCLW